MAYKKPVKAKDPKKTIEDLKKNIPGQAKAPPVPAFLQPNPFKTGGGGGQSIAPGSPGGGVFRGDGYTIENGVRYEDDPRGNVALTNERGETTGVIKDGRTLLGLSKQDVAKLAPEGTTTAVDIANQEKIQQQIAQIG